MQLKLITKNYEKESQTKLLEEVLVIV